MVAALEPVSIPLGLSFGLAFLFLGLALFAGIAALSHAGERAFSAAMIYLALGGCAGLIVLHLDVGRLASPLEQHRLLEYVTDGVLVVALFSGGMRIRRKPTLAGWQAPLRLIVLGMPAMIALVAIWGRTLMGLGVGAAIALGAALAPTDPVLAGDLGAKPPHAGEDDPQPEPMPEFALSVESGLNDGVGLAFLTLGLAVAQGGSLWHWAATRLVYGIVVAVLVGAVVGRLLALGASGLREQGFLSHEFDRWVGLAAAFAVYGAAEALGSFGFVAAFAGGVAFRRHELAADYRREVHDGASVLKHFGELAVILILGSMLAFGNFGDAGGWGLALAPVAIVVMRPLTAFVVLLGTPDLRLRERLWVAWFGVRGIASLNYAALVAGSAAGFGEHDAAAVVWTLLTTVALSIVVHGITSTPVSDALLAAPES